MAAERMHDLGFGRKTFTGAGLESMRMFPNVAG
jgi:hypothetical protein